MSHSKRNTSLAFFTSHERSELRGTWGSQSTRLTRDSFLPFGSCQLCLLGARDPVACASHGHLFCRECAVSNLLQQKKEIKRLEREWARRRDEDGEDRARAEGKALERDVRDFEAVQAGLEVKLGAGKKVVGRAGGRVVVEEEEVEAGKGKGTKRKLELDEDELVELSRDKAARRKTGDAVKPALPSFWVPSETPTSHTHAGPKPSKLNPSCPTAAADAPHDFSLKTLVAVAFSEDKDGTTGEAVRSCPACRKMLSNTTKAVLAKPCGHVVCKPCADKFLRPAQRDAHGESAEVGSVRCYVCQADVTERKKARKEGHGEKERDKEKEKIRPGLVELSSEGTGFAGGGKNMVKRAGVAFQC